MHFLSCSTASFKALDRNYLTPFFTSHNGDEDEDEDEDGKKGSSHPINKIGFIVRSL